MLVTSLIHLMEMGHENYKDYGPKIDCIGYGHRYCSVLTFAKVSFALRIVLPAGALRNFRIRNTRWRRGSVHAGIGAENRRCRS